MRAVMLMFDTLTRTFLPAYGCDWTVLPNFERLQERAVTFDRFFGGSMPCIPARRELHTGRYNFLHRSWGPLEPFDDSVIARLSKSGVYTHIATDHFHYWEDGGTSYLTKYDSHEMFRGQQGDLWVGQVEDPTYPPTASRREGSKSWRQDWVNRTFLDTDEKMPSSQAVAAGLQFLERNARSDSWFLQIECFDPHEPFFTQQHWKDLYPGDADALQLDWPDYGRNQYTPELTEQLRKAYAALLSMCDSHLGRVLDAFDELDLWDDTMLIVNTDHGFLLGEHEQMGKNIQPFFNEVIHLPFFVHDPAHDARGERRQELAQTVDIAPTIADYFDIEPPTHLSGHSLRPVIAESSPIREGALFGIHGAHVNVTDGEHVYMRAPNHPANGPLFEYTLAPSHMREQFSLDELRAAVLDDGFEFSKGAKLLKIPGEFGINAYWWGNRLYNIVHDPEQTTPLDDTAVELAMATLLRDLMVANEAPPEQFERLGLPEEGEITPDSLPQQTPFAGAVGTVTAEQGTVARLVSLWLTALTDDERESALENLSSRLGERTTHDLTPQHMLEEITRVSGESLGHRLEQEMFLYFGVQLQP